MSRTKRVYTKWFKNSNHPYNFLGQNNWWQQLSIGKSACYQFKDDYVFIHVHNKRKRILLKKLLRNAEFEEMI